MMYDMKKNKLMWLILFAIVLVIAFFVYNKCLGKIAIIKAKSYIKSQNISVDEYKFIRVSNMSMKFLFNSCQEGSGVLVYNNNGNYEYEDVLICQRYKSKINENNLAGSGIVILNYDEDFVDLDETDDMTSKDFDDVKIWYYNGSTRKIVIYTEDKTKNISGSNNNYYPTITLNGEKSIDVYYKEKYQELGYVASDKKDGDLTNNVIVKGKVDNKKIGTYIINYYVFNSQNNYVMEKRTVNIIPNEVNFKVDLTIEEKEKKTEADIILKINGSGYQYTKLPDGKISKDKNIVYNVNKNDIYTFLIYDLNDQEMEKTINVNSIDIMPPTGKCLATFTRETLNIKVDATDDGEIDTYNYSFNGVNETKKDNIYEYKSVFYKNRLPEVKVKITDKAKNSTEITCENVNNVIPEMYTDVNGYNCLEGYVCYKQRDYSTTYQATIPPGPGPLSTNGCLPTSMSIIASAYGFTSKSGELYTPPTLVNEVIYPDGKIWGVSSYDRIVYIADKLGLNQQKYGISKDFELLKEELRKGNQIVFNFARGCLAKGVHFLTIIGINDKDEIFISDPDTKSTTPNSYNPSVCNHKVNTWDDVEHLRKNVGVQYFVVISK